MPFDPRDDGVDWPPGWFADPWGQYEQRFWNGQVWTYYVYTGGRVYGISPTAGASADVAVTLIIPPLVGGRS